MQNDSVEFENFNIFGKMSHKTGNIDSVNLEFCSSYY